MLRLLCWHDCWVDVYGGDDVDAVLFFVFGKVMEILDMRASREHCCDRVSLTVLLVYLGW